MKAGIGYRHPWRRALLAGSGPDLLEVTADHFFADPKAIEALADRYPLVIHDVGCSIGTGGPDRARLARLAELVRLGRPIAFTDHLAMTRSPSGIELGHLCPVWTTSQGLATCVEAVSRLQDALRVPIALENISTPFVIPGADLDEGEFWERLTSITGCGLLLDVTNALLDALNAGADPRVRLARLPLSRARLAHLAGGRADGDWWVDSHSGPVDPESIRLLTWLRGQAPLEAVIVERDAHLPPVDQVIAEARAAAEAWEQG